MIVETFFRERVSEAVDGMPRSPSPEAKEYLVGVLSGFVWNTLDWEMMGYRLLGSMGPDRIVVLKEIGDSSLFLLGFFEEFCRSRMVGPGYYAQLGRSAYGELGTRFSRAGGQVFGELAREFPLFRETLGRVRAGMSIDRMAEYKEWIRNRSGTSELALRRVGLLVG